MGPLPFNAAESKHDAKYRIVNAGHKFLQQVLPIRRPQSDRALDDFLQELQTSHLTTYDLENVIIQCLGVLDRHVRLLPSLASYYMSSAALCSSRTAAINRFAAGVKELFSSVPCQEWLLRRMTTTSFSDDACAMN